MKLSLRKVFLLLLIVAILSVLIISGCALFLNSRVMNNQNQLIEATIINASRYTMSSSLSKFLIRQEGLLVANNSEAVLSLKKRNDITEHFERGLLSLASITSNHKAIAQPLHILKEEYKHFIMLDQQLLDLVDTNLLLQDKLKKNERILMQQMDDLQALLNQMYGILILDNVKIERQIKVILQTPNSVGTPSELDKFKVLISELLIGAFSDALEKSRWLNIDIARLATIVHQIMEETNPDSLTNLNNNQLVQLQDKIQQELQELSTAMQSSPDIYQISINSNNRFKKIIDQISKSPNNIIALRKNLNEKNVEMKEMITQIDKSQNRIINQFDILDKIATQLKNTLFERTKGLETNTRWLIISIAIFTLLFVAILGYYLLNAISSTLNKLIDTMKKISGEELNLTYRIEPTAYEDINEVGTAFNTMTSKLQFFNEHLQELVTSKTVEIEKSEKRISLRHDVTKILVEHISLSEAMKKILDTMHDFMQVSIVGVWKVNHEKNQLNCMDYWSMGDASFNEFIDISKKWVFPFGEGSLGSAWKNKTIIYIPDIAKGMARSKFAEKANLHSTYAVPIIHKGEISGVLEFLSKEFYTFDDNINEMINDISSQIGIFIDREDAQEKVAVLTRQAGMAEVATSILHNVGNILNSVKVTLTLLQGIMNRSDEQIKKLAQVMTNIQDNFNNLQQYLSEDPKGKSIPKYVSANIASLTEDNSDALKEIVRLIGLIHHIEEIVAMQESISGTIIIAEKISLSEILDTAINLCVNVDERNINIQKNYTKNLFLTTDKSLLLQLLVNILKNANTSLQDNDVSSDKTISITVNTKDDNSKVDILISDNGIGIPPENITKIFSQGFSTKPDGRGYGLHFSALTAKALGGTLQAKSDGVGKGATFCLTLPLK